MAETKEVLILDKTTVDSWRANAKNQESLTKYYNEIYNHDRTIRDTQVARVQKHKLIKKKVLVTDSFGKPILDEYGQEKTKYETVEKKAIRIPIPLKQKIINTSVAFEFGNPVSRIPNEKNELSEEVDEVWKENRLDSVLQEVKKEQKSITQSAIVFYIKTKNKKSKIKSRILKNKDNVFYPVKDDYGDMIYFVWEFAKTVNSKQEKYIWVFNETTIEKYRNTEGQFVLFENDPHYFDKIPVVYFEQELPEGELANSMIDRYEVSLSKLAASNNYSAHPILFTTGELTTPLDGDADGKHINGTIEKSDDGKVISGDAKFITNNNAADSVKLELSTLKSLIGEVTSTPDITTEALQGVGNIAGASLELLFLDPILKAKFNEGQNTTDIQRMLNVIISGIVNMTKKADSRYRAQAQTLRYDIVFNSIMPKDADNLANTLKTSIESGFLSKETAVEVFSYTKNSEEELERIAKETNTKTEE
jgi:SPP1 family phage portal protein